MSSMCAGACIAFRLSWFFQLLLLHSCACWQHYVLYGFAAVYYAGVPCVPWAGQARHHTATSTVQCYSQAQHEMQAVGDICLLLMVITQLFFFEGYAGAVLCHCWCSSSCMLPNIPKCMSAGLQQDSMRALCIAVHASSCEGQLHAAAWQVLVQAAQLQDEARYCRPVLVAIRCSWFLVACCAM
jgi:hypothetical protein